MLKEIYTWGKQNPGAIFKWSLFLCLIYFPIFIDLDVLPLRIWDETRLANNAYEMYKNGNYLVTYFQGMPELWNTKPPLMIWLQVLCMKTIGVGELAVRLPSAIAALLTCILIMLFAVRYLKSFWWGFGAVLVLVTTHGYINMHAARSGDYDALLTLFTTFYCLSFYLYAIAGKNKYLTWTFIGLTLAVLTKGIAGLLFLPALGIFFIIKGSIPALFRNKTFYINIAIFLVITLGYYLLREHYNPGYLNAVFKYELGGRYFKTLENHQHEFWFYYHNFIDFQFTYWYLFIPAGVVIGLANKNAQISNFTLYITLLFVTFFLIISNGKTKLQSYDVPMYPFMALIIGGLLHFFLSLLEKVENISSLKSSSLQYLSIVFLFLYPYKNIIAETYSPDESLQDTEFYQIGRYLKDAVRGERNLDNQHLLYEGYYFQNLFYTYILNDKGEKIDIVQQLNFKKGDKVIVCQQDMEDILNAKYWCLPMDTIKNIRTYQIDSAK